MQNYFKILVQDIHHWLSLGDQHQLQFASLAVSVDTNSNTKQRQQKIQWPTCAHDKDLKSLFKEIDSDNEGYLNIWKMRVRTGQNRRVTCSALSMGIACNENVLIDKSDDLDRFSKLASCKLTIILAKL